MNWTGGWPETDCGAGSTLKATKGLRSELPELLKRLGVETLLDAPCGDCNWIRHVDLSGILYFGVDISPKLLGLARQRMPNVKEGDIVKNAFPAFDAVLCRDFLQHLPTADALKVLANFSKAKWLIATSHHADENKELETDYRPLNLMKPPFNLPEPVEVIPDGNRILGVWSLQ
jgi:SAM-dependent methyltransferase